MRIIAGEFGARKLLAPPNLKTRPTTDRVRESIFSALTSRLGSFEGLNVLDAFAGSGALGLEAISRGAKQAWFFEKNARACRVLKTNINNLSIDKQRAKVFMLDVFLSPSRGEIFDATFNLVLLDPPYAFDANKIAGFCEQLRVLSLLEGGAVIMYEHSSGTSNQVLATFEACSHFKCDGNRKFGSTTVSYFIVH